MVDSVSVNELDSIDDEDLLRSMLDKSEDFDLRRQIRSRLRAINRTKPAGDVDSGSAKTAPKQQQQQVPARIHQPKETRAAATSLSAPKHSDEIDGRRTNQRQLQTPSANVTSTSTTGKQSVVLRSVEPSLKSNKPQEIAKSELQESVTLRKVGEVKSSTSASVTSNNKTGFLEGTKLRKVEDVKPSNETSINRRPAGQQKSEFMETVTLRKVEGVRTSSPAADSTATRKPVRNFTPKMAREHFKGMDAATGGGNGEETPSNRSSYMGNVRQAMLDWCRFRVAGYENVDIADFSGSWSNGLAFCALVHSFFPDAFDFDALDPNARRHNLQLAFTVAEQRGGVYPLLDVDDMIQAGPNQDWKSIFTYVNSIYSDLASHKTKPSLELNADDKAPDDCGANNGGGNVDNGAVCDEE